MQLLQEAVTLFTELDSCVKQVVVSFGSAGVGMWVGLGAKAVLQACCKVVERPMGNGQLRGKVVPVDEFPAPSAQVVPAVGSRSSGSSSSSSQSAVPAAGGPLAAAPRLEQAAWHASATPGVMAPSAAMSSPAAACSQAAQP
ncbi:hypothetical protein QJQ45_010061 [Haematococcus lacustris]|nr:hypothetical protein QJQ45_010061 [Haematococcus lacustris]